ncbi:hypothetical protein [Faecalibacterium prausnitzii]|uniref:hypothetical protein n=1 Tax=Faecalibacterium prausnitzii TaxID=853 RepID=UPI0022E159A9|nr:hypothetical protein [Faecalibacterium prausnitzii]
MKCSTFPPDPANAGATSARWCLCLLMMGGCFGVSTLMLLAQMLGRGFTIHL